MPYNLSSQINPYLNTSDMVRFDHDTAIGQGCKANQKGWNRQKIPLPAREANKGQNRSQVSNRLALNKKGYSGITVTPRISWSWRRESNPQPADYKSAALPLSHASQIVNRLIPCGFTVVKAKRELGKMERNRPEWSGISAPFSLQRNQAKPCLVGIISSYPPKLNPLHSSWSSQF